VRALVTAVLAGQHSLLLGPPGTGKSALARDLAGRIGGARYWEILLSKFTDPKQVFGPVDVGAVTLRVYAHRTRPTDQRAAELLAEQLRGRPQGGRPQHRVIRCRVSATKKSSGRRGWNAGRRGRPAWLTIACTSSDSAAGSGPHQRRSSREPAHGPAIRPSGRTARG
jgi:hypothetical protein